MELTPQTPIALIDNMTGQVLATGVYANVKRMRSRADRLDLAYGAVRYSVRVGS